MSMKSKNHHIEEGNKERTARVQSEETEPSIDRIMKDLLTVEEVARRLKISKATVRRHIREGRLRAAKIGRVVRISPEDVKSLFHPMDEVKKSKSSLDWLEECRKLSRKIKKRHGGALLEDSSETIRSLREGRTLSE